MLHKGNLKALKVLIISFLSINNVMNSSNIKRNAHLKDHVSKLLQRSNRFIPKSDEHTF